MPPKPTPDNRSEYEIEWDPKSVWGEPPPKPKREPSPQSGNGKVSPD
jgi:hypothetical protein